MLPRRISTNAPSTTTPLCVLKKLAANLKLNGKWLWLAICVGRGSQVLTHGNGLKKITYRLLPRTEEAKNNKPPGLHEIRDTLDDRTHKGSTLVFDGWIATTQAADRLGYKHPPSVKHHKCFRDGATGLHTNNAESENNRLKRWSRQRHMVACLSRSQICRSICSTSM